MKLNPMQFRTFGGVEHPVYMRVNTQSPLILVQGNGDISFAKNRTDKDALVAKFNPKKDVLLYAWAGEFSTDVFTVTPDDLKKHYDPQ